MNIVHVNTKLQPANLKVTDLNVLEPDNNIYSTLLYQPMGKVQLGANGVFNSDSATTHLQYRMFLDMVRDDNVDLAITPEYSLPWELLKEELISGEQPTQGKLWVFGCEGITNDGLENFKRKVSETVEVLHEPINKAEESFVSPLAYVFKAAELDDPSKIRTVLLVQFKTTPMGDQKQYEVNSMIKGKTVYQFGGENNKIKLVSLICADAFAFSDDMARQVHDRALIIHIQLNPDPHHLEFTGCRASLLKYRNDETEIICLNWARNVQESYEGTIRSWENPAGSAWYLKSQDCDTTDESILRNHRLGLYYTWMNSSYAHALHLNYKPAVFLLKATKVAHIGVPGPLSKRHGPKLKHVFLWNTEESKWSEHTGIEDGFSDIVHESGGAQNELIKLAECNPILVERVLALCAGIAHDSKWYNVNKLDSCILDSSEIVYRITFCQDESGEAITFRNSRLRRCGQLWEILMGEDELPSALADLKDGFELDWNDNSPHQNILSRNGDRATAMYLGEDFSEDQIKKTATLVAENLHQSTSSQNESHSAKQRMIIWYRGLSQELVCIYPDKYLNFDETGVSSEVDIARED